MSWGMGFERADKEGWFDQKAGFLHLSIGFYLQENNFMLRGPPWVVKSMQG